MEVSVAMNLTDYSVSEGGYSLQNEDSKHKVLYKVNEQPPFIFSLLNAVQILLCQVLNVVWLPLLLTPSLCTLPGEPIRAYLVSTAFLTAGVVTSVQSTFGIRLPTVAAPSLLYTASFLSLLRTAGLQCPSDGDLYAMGPELRTLEWQARLREIQGAIMFAGISQALVGFSGLQACMCRLLGPVAVAPALILVGLTSIREPLPSLINRWSTFSLVAVLLGLFALQLRKVCLPLPTLSIHNGLKVKCFPIFRMFPVLWTCVAAFAIYKALIMFSYTTPYEDKEATGFQEAVDNAKWFFFPFPFEWGLPTLSISTVVHILPTIILQSVTSLFLMYGAADVCDVDVPPCDVITRAIGVGGMGLVFGSMWGQAVSNNPVHLGLINFTGIVSRSSVQLAALMMVCLSHFTRVTFLLANIPTQFLYALQFCLYAGVVCIGISMLRFVRFTTRDGFIVGISLFLGLAVHQNPPSIATGDNILSQILSSPVLVGGLAGCTLDLLVPDGIDRKSKERRIRTEDDENIYRLPTWEELLCNVLESFPFLH